MAALLLLIMRLHTVGFPGSWAAQRASQRAPQPSRLLPGRRGCSAHGPRRSDAGHVKVPVHARGPI